MSDKDIKEAIDKLLDLFHQLKKTLDEIEKIKKTKNPLLWEECLIQAEIELWEKEGNKIYGEQ